jgi:1-acyl-sn-glycerol-3-phosphate acyltransferase
VYWVVRAFFQPFFHTYWRLSRVGREHVPQEGPVIFACNHRSFLDPFIIGTLARRPLYFVAKAELFKNPLLRWFISSLGAFPVARGVGDSGAMDTARAILERGDCVVIFPEGTRVRPGPLGPTRRGVGRLALETGAPVVPVAVIGTENIRNGLRIRPHKVRIRAGRALRFPRVDHPSPALAGAVTDRIWPCVQLQWEWLGGIAPVRRAAVLGAGSWGTGLAVALTRGGIDTELGCRTEGQVEAIGAHGQNRPYLPNVTLPPELRVGRAATLDLSDRDLVVFAMPASELPAAVAAYGDHIPASAGVVVCAKGIVDQTGQLPLEYVSERLATSSVACLGGPAHSADALANGASVVVGGADPAFTRLVADALAHAGFDVVDTTDAVGVQLAGVAKNAAVLAAATAAVAGPNAAGAAAGKVFAEIDAYARKRGGRADTFAGLAGAGDLVATVVAAHSRNRRAGEMLGRGVPVAEIGIALGQTAEGIAALPLLAHALKDARVAAPAVDGLAAVVEGREDAETWATSLTTPGRPLKRAAA